MSNEFSILARFNSIENLKLSVLQVVAIVYERWSLKRSSNHSDLSCQVMFYFGTSLWGGGEGV